MRAIGYLAVLAALAAGGCDLTDTKDAPAPSATPVATACTGSALSNWNTGQGPFTVEAYAGGPTCQQAVATIVIRDAEGAPMHVAAYPIEFLFGFAEVASAASLQSALQDWIAVEGSPLRTTADLPTWAVGAEQPESGEFPFYPAEGYAERTVYEELRGQALPAFCYPQGMESLACVALREGQLESVGLQTFPG